MAHEQRQTTKRTKLQSKFTGKTEKERKRGRKDEEQRTQQQNAWVNVRRQKISSDFSNNIIDVANTIHHHQNQSIGSHGCRR